MSPAPLSDRGHEDLKHRSISSSQVYDKKRKYGDYLDVDGQEYAGRLEKGDGAGKDALTDFRANVAEEETRKYRHRGSRRADSTVYQLSGKIVHHRGYDAHSSSRRHKDYEARKSHQHQSRDQRYSHPDETFERGISRHTRHSAPKDIHDCGDTTPRGRSRDHGSPDRSIVDRRRDSTNEYVKKTRKDDRRGRSLSRSSSAHRFSRSSSSVSSDHYSSRRKRRRSHSRSRSRSKERRKDRKERRSSGKKKDKERSETRRSVLTGKKLKLKVKKDKDDVERDAKRQELLRFLNSACD